MSRIITACVSLLFFWGCTSEYSTTTAEPDFSEYLSLSLEERQSPEHATGGFEVADDLAVELFAAEPMVVNPTNLAIDERGRVWVCESYNYAVPEKEQKEEGGRIIILEDTDGDGKADERTVFYQGKDVHLALGISIFGNRVFVARSPNLLVFTDEDGDDVPDRKEKLFTGMGHPGDHSAHAVVFGPDGRFYFNYGNAGHAVLSASGDTIRDRSGHLVRSVGNPFHGGMVFRFDRDGSNFEVLGHNFRNNYEVAIDAFGTLWQSDNDDDGNKGVRINYVMEYGNYGYLDENTGAHWTRPRTGMHEEIPYRHWHQNDPGVVPNLLHTGAGSPAGILVYEGDLLPEALQGQVIHADAGPSVVRAYPATKDKAGYRASTYNIVQSHKDQWFRPVDVAVAPDGSLFIADWYDPIVGGGAAGDHERGRIFRVAPPGKKYRLPKLDLSSLANQLKGLDNANEAVRYKSWMALHQAGEDAEPLLQSWWKDGSVRQRARALWLLGQLPARSYLAEAARDEEELIRIVAIRLARQLEVSLPAFLTQFTSDPSPAVRREVAIALRYENGPEAAKIWSELARHYDGEDRWYLEALGIGAEMHWEEFFKQWQTDSNTTRDSKPGRDIIWRARARAAIPLLSRLIADPATTEKDRLRYFRAFDFHQHESKNEALLSLLDLDHPAKEVIRDLALQHIEADRITMTPALRQAIEQTLTKTAGTWQYVDLIAKFNLAAQKSKDLLEMALQAQENEAGSYAARLLTEAEGFDGLGFIRQHILKQEEDGPALLHAMETIGRDGPLRLMQDIIWNDALGLDLRRAAVLAMGKSWYGEDILLETVKDSRFPKALEPAAASVLFSVYRTSIHQEAANYLTKPETSEQRELPPIRVLVATDGNPERGRELFGINCQSCHKIQGEGIDFGPDLSYIGDKLSREGLYRAIIYPDEGVNFGYHTCQLTLRSGDVTVGLLTSETDTQIDLKLVGGEVRSYPKSEIAEKEMLPNSLMTNLSLAMSQEELIDLVAYLVTLRESI